MNSVNNFQPRRPSVTALGLLAVLLIFGGIAGVVFFGFYFDPSVPVSKVDPRTFGLNSLPLPMPDRVNNLGLLQDRQNGIILSAVAIVVGVLVAIYDAFVRRQGSLARCPECHGDVDFQARRCKHCGGELGKRVESAGGDEVFFILRKDVAEGPFSLGQLRVFLACGSLNRETLCAQNGDPGWKQLGDVLR